MTTQVRQRRHRGRIVAAAAFVAATAAVVASALALAHPAEPAHHTVNIVTPPPVTYSSAKIQAAKNTACAAWDRAARTVAAAANARAELSDTTGGSSIETEEARMVEKRVAAVEVKFLRTQISPATPPSVKTPITDWMAAQIDSMHGANIRHWDESNAATERGNDLVDVIAPACGLR
ncbi:MAG: hypothetical protein K0U84_08695 [Actinomycetia bacterium]|nr:hypothetical protein [Actinomycetes bacterium]